jgi:hypothetical protein
MKKVRFLGLLVIFLLVTLCLIYAASVVIEAPRSNTFIGPIITSGYPLYNVSVNVSINVNATLLNVTINNVEVCSNNTWNLSQYNCSWYVNETAEGNYTLAVNITNSSGITINNQSTGIMIDRTSPAITVNYPENALNQSSGTINFNWTAIDNFDFSLTCGLMIDSSVNATVESANNSATNFSVSTLTEGRHNWNLTCSDHTLNNYTSTTRDFVIDQTDPSVNITSPANGTSTTTATNSFAWTATDNLATQMLCNLTIDSTIQASNVESNNGSSTTQGITLGAGTHYWNVTCTDNSGNSNTSQTWMLTTSSPPPGGSSGGGNSASRFYTTVEPDAIEITEEEMLISAYTHSPSKIEVGSQEYDLRVSRILDEQVELRIGDNYFTVNKDEEITLDLNADQKDDLSIKTTEVYFNRVNMLMKRLVSAEATETAVEERKEVMDTVEKDTLTQTEQQAISEDQQITSETPPVSIKKSTTLLKEIIAIAAILVIIIFISLKYIYPAMKK